MLATLLSQPQEKTLVHKWALIFTGEASFRQDSTLHATWSRIACPPEVLVYRTTPECKDFGAFECPYSSTVVILAGTPIG